MARELSGHHWMECINRLKAENEKLRDLLRRASCPIESCVMGSIYVLDQSQNTMDVEKCHWCKEVKDILKGGE